MTASMLNVAARIKTTANNVVHISSPPVPVHNLKVLPKMQQKYGTHLDTRAAEGPLKVCDAGQGNGIPELVHSRRE